MAKSTRTTKGGSTPAQPKPIRSQAEGHPPGQGLRVTWQATTQDTTYRPPAQEKK
jgi:hypothetical protein